MSSTEAVIVGYERIPDGNACELCELAAGQRYKTSDLLPIHGGCGCGVEPITEDQLFNPKKGERAELRNGIELKKDEWVPVQGAVRGKVVRKTDKHVMLNAGTDAKPRWVQGTRLDVRKPVRAKAVTKRPKVIDPDKLPKIEPTLKGQALRDHLDQPKSLFDAAERDAIRAYTGSKKTDIAERLNRALRKGTFGPRSKTASVKDGLDSAFGRITPLREPGLVFRGTKVKFGRALQPGAVIEDAGYMSTSPSRSVAANFMPFDGDLFEIVLPRGAKALDINEAAGSAYGFERETLLPRGTRLVIESIGPNPKKTGQRIIRARVLL